VNLYTKLYNDAENIKRGISASILSKIHLNLGRDHSVFIYDKIIADVQLPASIYDFIYELTGNVNIYPGFTVKRSSLCSVLVNASVYTLKDSEPINLIFTLPAILTGECK